MSWLSSSAWRWRQLTRSRRRLAVAAVALVGAAALAVVVASYLGPSRGPVTGAAWVLLVVAALLAAGRLALFNLKRRTRRHARAQKRRPTPDLDVLPTNERTPA